MQYEARIKGVSPIIMHNGTAGLDTRSPAKIEITELTRIKATNRPIADVERVALLETQVSLWLDPDGKPEIPQAAIRACIEQAARKLKQGPQVREGLLVLSTSFEYDTDHYGTTLAKLGEAAQFTVPVVVQRQRINRTRAKFDLPWACVFKVDVDDELVDKDHLATWLDIGGRRIGLGDWRPAKSGLYGRFSTVSVKVA